MISVILSILKFILIILASILGLILLIIFLILFVPIRYEVNAKLDKSLSGKARVSWLLRLLSLKVSYVEEEMDMKVTILGIEVPTGGKSDEKSDKKPNKAKARRFYRDKTKNDKAKSDQSKQDKVKQDKSHKEQRTKDISLQKDPPKPLIDDDKKPTTSKNLATKAQKPPKKSKILDILRKIKDFFFKVINIIKSILIKVYNFLLQIESEEAPPNKLIQIKTFIQDNKSGIKRLIKGVKDFVKHILPKKFEGDIEFGTGDPSTTGQALGIISIFYGVYNKSLQLIPNFQDKMLQGEVLIKGRIRLFTIVIIGLRLMLDKNFKSLWNNYKIFKEEL